MESVQIRKYQEDDILGFYEAVMESRQEISQWLPWCDEHYAIQDTIQWVTETTESIWASGRGCEFVIIDPQTNRVLGGCCLEQINLVQKEASLGYWVRTSEAQKGIATRASYFLLEYGFRELGLDPIKIIPSVENVASVKVAEKLPYTDKVKVPDGFQIRDRISDALVYTITRVSFTKGIYDEK